MTLREIEQVDPKTGEMSRIRAYSAPVRVTVPGVPPRTDIGFHAVAEETAEGHDTACKGSVTDGLKRALRSFGDQFGNCLYGDQAATGQPAKQESAADSLAPSLRATLIDLGAMQGFDEKQVRAAVKGKMGKDLEAGIGIGADDAGARGDPEAPADAGSRGGGSGMSPTRHSEPT